MTRRRWTALGAAAALVGLLVALALVLPDGGPAPDAGPSAPPAAAPTPADTAEPDAPVADPAADQAAIDEAFALIVRRDPDDPLAMGAVDAPVVMAMWADFRCGYCARHALETAPGLAELVAAGTLRIEWHDFAVVTEESPAIAAAARAAGRQGRFWEFHDRVFADHATRPVMDDAYLREIAADLGLDLAAFDADRASPEVLAAVEADGALGARLGVTGTPAFIINGVGVPGAQPLEVFEAVVRDELARATAAADADAADDAGDA
ncbi:MAG: thioredoxin domain-containing protein [Actinomycetales bacterium]|jgi:protein-disulfide isomerase|nr:thioredoxin domain-containing protein [Actinomycetales bacterium]